MFPDAAPHLRAAAPGGAGLVRGAAAVLGARGAEERERLQDAVAPDIELEVAERERKESVERRDSGKKILTSTPRHHLTTVAISCGDESIAGFKVCAGSSSHLNMAREYT